MSETTMNELVRDIQRLGERQKEYEDRTDRRFNDVVYKAVYDLAIGNIQEDTREIKDSQKWMQRLLVGNFVTLIVALILFLLERSAG